LLLLFLGFSSSADLCASIYFTNFASHLAIKESHSKVALHNSDKIIGWSEFSILKKHGLEGSSQWAQAYADDTLVSQEGSEEPATQLIIANSNALNYGIKNTSNAIMNYSGAGLFTVAQKHELLEDVRTYSRAFVYCCKNTSNAFAYGIENNSNALSVLAAGSFSGLEKQAFVDYVRTTSSGLLDCCKNTSNAFVYALKNNSNAIILLGQSALSGAEKQDLLQTVYTTSDALLYCCKNTSNALVFGIKNNSTALVNYPLGAFWSIYEKEELYETIRVNSNAFVYCCKNASNAIVSLRNDVTALQAESDITVYTTHKTYTSDAIEQPLIMYNAGFTVESGNILTLSTPFSVAGEINLGDTGTLNLQRDLYLDSQAYVSNGGILDGNGNALVLACNFTIPENQIIRVTGDTIINGHGTTITLEPHAQITIDNNVTLTIKNARIKNTRNSSSDPMISVSGIGRLALQNVELALADDYYFDNGLLFVHDDVVVSGTSSFVYTSSLHSYIAGSSMWAFDKRTTFYYDPNVSNNNCIHMQNETSCMYYNNATLLTGDMGIRLSNGALYLDNNVMLSCPVSTQIIFGDSSQTNGDLDVHVLGGAYVEIDGVVFDDSMA